MGGKLHRPHPEGGAPVRVDAEAGLGEVRTHGLTPDDNEYVNTACGASEVTLCIDTGGGVGAVNLEVADQPHPFDASWTPSLSAASDQLDGAEFVFGWPGESSRAPWRQTLLVWSSLKSQPGIREHSR